MAIGAGTPVTAQCPEIAPKEGDPTPLNRVIIINIG
jgi:hypothetical protein